MADGVVIPQKGPLLDLVSNLRSLINEEMEVKEIPSFSISVTTHKGPIYSEGFGFEDEQKTVKVGPNSVFRVGSITKLFTDIAALQLVQQGKLDLDVPVSTYLSTFQPKNPFSTQITLRHLMSHHSGLTREPPRGHYIDSSPTVSLQDTVDSLNETELFHEPGTTQKYSNAGIAVVGRVLEVTYGMSYYKIMRKYVLDPLGMDRSDFELSSRVEAHIAHGAMYAQDHRLDRKPPVFNLGEDPAGSLYSTATDLDKFAKMLMNSGKLPDGTTFLNETLFREMLTPQFKDADKKGMKHLFGLGFMSWTSDGVPAIGHGGAIYGYTSRFTIANINDPEKAFSIILLCSGDCAMTPIKRIFTYAMSQLHQLIANGKEKFELKQWLNPTRDDCVQLEGLYIEQGDGHQFKGYGDKLFKQRIELDNRFGHLMMRHDKGYSRLMLMVGDDPQIPKAPSEVPNGMVFDVVDRIVEMEYVVIDKESQKLYLMDSTSAITKSFNKVTSDIPPEPEQYPQWDCFIGEYGPDHAPTYIFERYGKLFVLIEWTMQYPLHPTEDPNVWTLPSHDCFYNDEKIIFSNIYNGMAMDAEVTGMLFHRRLADVSSDKTYVIQPQRPVEELRKEAMAAEPPKSLTTGAKLSPDLFDMSTMDKDFKFDIRYATENNFMGAKFYRLEKAFAQRPAAECIVKAHHWLMKQGFGLVIFDIYRPWHVTKMFWDATPASQRHFVANPETGSIHNRGCAIDCSLYDLKTGKIVSMTSGFDEMTPRAYRDYPGGTTHQRWLQTVLRTAMQKFKFEVYEYEWWHFNFESQFDYPVMNVAFEDLSKCNE